VDTGAPAATVAGVSGRRPGRPGVRPTQRRLAGPRPAGGASLPQGVQRVCHL